MPAKLSASVCEVSISLDWRWCRAAPMLYAIEPGQQLGNRHVELGRDVFVDIDLGQQGHQFRRFVHINTMLLSAGDDLLGNQSLATRHNAGGRIGLAVGEGNRLAHRITRWLRHVVPAIRSNSSLLPRTVSARPWLPRPNALRSLPIGRQGECQPGRLAGGSGQHQYRPAWGAIT